MSDDSAKKWLDETIQSLSGWPAYTKDWAPRVMVGDIRAVHAEWAVSDDLLRQAIEALTNSCDLLENYIDTFGDMSGANRADLNDYRAVLTAYDKRGK